MHVRAPHFSVSDQESQAGFDKEAQSTPGNRLRLTSNRGKNRKSSRSRSRSPQRPNDEISTRHLNVLLEEWLDYGRLEGQSPRTAELRRMLVGRLEWFLEQKNYVSCGGFEMRNFFVHLIDGHLQPQGRWSCGSANKGLEPLSPSTISTYHRHFSAFFHYLIEQKILEVSPMGKVPKQRDKADQIEPFTQDQLRALLRTAAASRYPKRNTAILRLLLDTGMRASELCGLHMGHVDLFEARARVLGKGNKERTVYWGQECARALRSYIREEYYTPENYQTGDPLFLAERGIGAGAALTYTGLRLLITKMGKRAGLQGVRCSPHTFRHTFAIEFLRAGGGIETLREILGHTTLKMTMEYVKLAHADIQANQRQFSPGDRLKKQS